MCNFSVRKKAVLVISFLILFCTFFASTSYAAKRKKSSKVPKFVYHIVQEDETLNDISKYYGVSKSRIIRYNKKYRKREPKKYNKVKLATKDLKNKEGYRYAIAMEKIKKKGYFIHHVQKGESFASIADDYGIKEKDLRKTNKSRYKDNAKLKYHDKIKVLFKGIKNHNAIKTNMNFILKEKAKKKKAARKKKNTTKKRTTQKSKPEPESKVVYQKDNSCLEECDRLKAALESEKETLIKYSEELDKRNQQLLDWERRLKEKEEELKRREQKLNEKEKELRYKEGLLGNKQPLQTQSSYESMSSFRPQTTISQGGRYHIIVGSFRSFNRARRELNRLSSTGYNLRLLPTFNGLHRICAGSFHNEHDARQSLNQLKSTYLFPRIWLLQQ